MAHKTKARSQESIAMEKHFYSLLYQSRRNRTKFSKNSVYLTDEIYKKTIRDVLYSKSLKTKKPRDWWLLARYDVITENGEHKIILPETEKKPLYYVRDSEIFGILEKCHNSVGHAGRDRMIKMLSDKYKNVIRQHVEIFLQICDFCQKRQKKPRHPISSPPPTSQSTQDSQPVINENEFNSRCQFDIIDLHSWPTDDYRYVLVYQDSTTKFLTLRALRYAKAEDVSKELLNIFFLIGAPLILQSGHGVDFTRRTIMHLRNSWDNLKISVGENVTKLEDTQDIESLIKIWMRDNQSKEWTKCIGNIQMTKNNTCCLESKLSPFQKVFKRKMKFGLLNDDVNEDIVEGDECLKIMCKVCNNVTIPAAICKPCLSVKTVVQPNRNPEITLQKRLTRETIFCTAYGCPSNSTEVVFFSFPKNRNRCIDWLKAICRDDLLSKDAEYINKKHKICSRHFKPSMFPSGEKNVLLPSAYPQLSLDCGELSHSIFGSSFQTPDANSSKVIKLVKNLPNPDEITITPLPVIKQENSEKEKPAFINRRKRKASVTSEDADSDEYDSIFGDYDFQSDHYEPPSIPTDNNLNNEIQELREHAVNLSKTYNLVKKLISLELRRNSRSFNDSDIQSMLTQCKTNSKKMKIVETNDVGPVVIKSEPIDESELTVKAPVELEVISPSVTLSLTRSGNANVKEETSPSEFLDVSTVIIKEEINV